MGKDQAVNKWVVLSEVPRQKTKTHPRNMSTTVNVFLCSWQVNAAPSLLLRRKEIEKKSWSWCWTGLLKVFCRRDLKDFYLLVSAPAEPSPCLQKASEFRLFHCVGGCWLRNTRQPGFLLVFISEDVCRGMMFVFFSPVSSWSSRCCRCTTCFFWLQPLWLPASS